MSLLPDDGGQGCLIMICVLILLCLVPYHCSPPACPPAPTTTAPYVPRPSDGWGTDHFVPRQQSPE
jgi:hypothetical protein